MAEFQICLFFLVCPLRYCLVLRTVAGRRDMILQNTWKVLTTDVAAVKKLLIQNNSVSLCPQKYVVFHDNSSNMFMTIEQNVQHHL